MRQQEEAFMEKVRKQSEETENSFFEDARKDYYGRVEQTVMFDPSITYQEKSLYALLCAYAGAKEKCWPSQKTMGENLNVTDRAVRGWVSGLLKKKVLLVKRRKTSAGGWANIYTLIEYRNPRSSGTGTHVPPKDNR